MGGGGVTGVLRGVFARMGRNPETDGPRICLPSSSGVEKRTGKRVEYLIPHCLNRAMIRDATISQTGFRPVLKTPWAGLWATLKNLVPVGGAGKGFVLLSECHTSSGGFPETPRKKWIRSKSLMRFGATT